MKVDNGMASKEAREFKDKSIEYDSKIINSITPFSILAYDKKKKIEIFVGRENDLRSLTELLFKSVYGEQSFGTIISGPGGCGKSTLFGYFMQEINNQEIFKNNYCKLKKDECKIVTCFIDAPKGELTTLKYFWTSIIDALTEEEMEFLEKFAILLIIKGSEILWNNSFKKEELNSIFSKIIPNFNDQINHYKISELVDIKKIFDVLTTQEDTLKKISNIISQGWRILEKYKVNLMFIRDSSNIIQKRIFKFEKRYFDLLIDILSNDLDKRTKAQNIFKGLGGELIKSDNDVLNILNWLTQTWEWIEEKPISFVIGVDNIGYLTVELENKSSAYIPFIQTILQMRNSLKKFLFILIGTNEDWRLFDNYVMEHQDYKSQLQGFIVNRIDLTRLTLNEVLQSLSLIMNKFWISIGTLHPISPLYPFSKEFFTYLYELFAHDYRSILVFLDKIWSLYKSSTKVISFEDPFFMIRFVRIINESKPLQLDNLSSVSNDLTFNCLINWEKEQIKIWFEKLNARSIGQKQSSLVEDALEEILRIFQDNEEPKQINWVEKRKAINITTNKGKNIRIPDIYVELNPTSISDSKKCFEIQVKMYDHNKYVKLTEIESSLELLKTAHTDALLFLITGAGLEEKAFEKIRQLNLEDRILFYHPLNDEQFKALAFLIVYKELTGKKPSINIIKEILELLFNQSWDELIEKIKNIGFFKETRISKEIKRKEKSTLESYIEAQTAEIEAPSAEAEIEPEEVEAPSAEVKIEPEEVEAPSTEVKIEPEEVEAPSTEVKIEPEEVEAPSTEVKIEPEEVEAPSAEAKIKPEEVEAPSAEAKIEPEEVEAPSAEVKIKPEEVESTLIEEAIKPEEKIDNFDSIIFKLNLEKSKEILKNVYKRYKSSIKELKFIIDQSINRHDRWHGQITQPYLKKNVPPHLSDENIHDMFTRLNNEFTKKRISKEELLFTYEGSSLIITELGKSLSKILNELGVNS